MVVGLVCAVDINTKRPSGIKIDNGNPKRLQAPRTLLGARDSRGDVVLDVVQLRNKQVGSRAGTHTQNKLAAVVLYDSLYIVIGRAGYRRF